MTAVPVAITVTRYRCPFCPRSRSKKQATVEHIQRCWSNPANRTCKTCLHYDVDCEEGELCINDRAPEPDEFPVVACPLWEPRVGETAPEPTRVPCRLCGTDIGKPRRHEPWRGQWVCDSCAIPTPNTINGIQLPF